MKLTVVGVPVPQGSKSAYPFRRKDGSTGIAMTEGKKAPALKEWRAAIADGMRQHLASVGYPAPLDGALILSVRFFLPRPKSLPRRELFPKSKPDLDKLTRAVGDALKGIAYTEDSRIVGFGDTCKRFAVDSPPRVEIELRQATEADL